MRFDIAVDGEADAALAWLKREGFRLQGPRFADFDRPAVVAYFNDENAKGFVDRFTLLFPEGTDREEITAHPVVASLVECVFRYSGAKPDMRTVRDLGEDWRRIDQFERDVSPEGLAARDEARAARHLADMRRTWNMFIGDFDFPDRGFETFMSALDSDRIHVHRDQCEDDPQEVCLRARGTDVDGTYWKDVNLMLLSPWWAEHLGPASEALADAIVDSWEELRQIRKAMLSAEPAPASR